MKRLPACFALLFVSVFVNNIPGFAQTTYASSIFAQVGSFSIPYASVGTAAFAKLADNSYAIMDGYAMTTVNSAFVVKTDSDGVAQWVKEFYLPSSAGNFFANDIVPLPDSGFVISGTINGEYLILIRADKNGNSLWSKSYQQQISFQQASRTKVFYYPPSGLQVLRVCNGQNNQMGNAVMRVDLSTGNFISNTYIDFPGPQSYNELIEDVLMDAQHNTYVLAGDGVGYEVSYYRLDSSLQVVSAVVLSDPSAALVMNKMAFHPDGNIVLSGYGCNALNGGCGTVSAGFTKSSRILKITPAGQVLFSKRFYQAADIDGKSEIGIRGNGNILVYQGMKELNSNDKRIRNIQLDANGNFISSNEFLGERIAGLFMNQDAPLLFFELHFSPFTPSCFVQMQMDTASVSWCSYAPSPVTTATSNFMVQSTAVQLTPVAENGITTTPVAFTVNPGTTPGTTNYCLFNSAQQPAEAAMKLKVMPNPATDRVTVSTGKPISNASCIITDIFGKEVQHIGGVNTDSFTIQKNNLPPGIYLIRVFGDGVVYGTARITFTE